MSTPAKYPRTITTAEGIYVHADDLKRALADDQLIQECATMAPVGKAMGHDPVNVLRHIMGYFIATQCRRVARMGEAGKVHPMQKSNLVALATLLEFVDGSKVQELSRDEQCAAAQEAILGLKEIIADAAKKEMQD